MPDRGFDALIQLMGPDLVQDPIELYGFDIDAKLRTSAPAILKLEGVWVGLVRVRGNQATILRPDRSTTRITLQDLWSKLTVEAAAPHRAAINALLDGCGINPARRERAFNALLRERIRTTRLATIHRLRTSPGSSFLRQLREAGVLTRLAGMLCAHGSGYLLWLAAWWMLGRSALSGRIDTGWIAAWALLLFAIIPFRVWNTWWQGKVAIGAGGLLRRRLLAGALRLAPEEVRYEGVGSFLGRAIESESVESLALGGGMASGLAAFELLVSAVVLAMGTGGRIELPLLALWLSVIAAFGWAYWQRRERWTAARLAITHDLIENMTGHRTRLAQQLSNEWHTGENLAVDEYVVLSEAMDRAGARLTGFAPRGWLVLGIAGLLPAFLDASNGAAASPPLAVALGGILLAWQAQRRLAGGLAQLAGAAISWKQIALLFHAASRTLELPAQTEGLSETVIEARDLSFRYPSRQDAVLSGATLRIQRGDHVLLEGESGGGKSTFTALLAGLRQPSSGTVLRRGRVTEAPQYHENHILTGTFAFNLLMGRNWPPSQADLTDAKTIATELGLGPLIERMPGGLLQMVGETGWQLSQGERSRIFLARALLEHPDLVILDESFAALDPENLRLSLECALKRSRSLIVVAHP